MVMLPAEVTVAVLQRVPQRHRLGQCALVCHSWLAAAVAATTGVFAEPTRPAHMESLTSWLQHHGSRVSDLSIVDLHLNLDIPFSILRQLRELHLTGLNINASNSGDSSSSSSLHSGTWADLTALTSLHLASVTLNNSGDGSDFNSITSLRRLVSSTIDLSCKRLPSLAPLTHLTCLVLQDIAFMKGDVQGIGQLNLLKHLRLATDYHDIQVLSSLPLSLTHLDLGPPSYGIATWEITASTSPKVGELTALEHLQVRGEDRTCFEPQLLSSLVQLRHLSLGSCQLKHHQEAEEGVDGLLAVLPRLSNLQHLCLVNSMVYPTEPVQQYSALISSPALTHLDLRGCCLQEDAVLFMFRGQQCPALQQLRLGTDNFHLGIFFGDELVSYPARMNALEALISACPALKELQLSDTTVNPNCGAQLSALEDLPGLSKLALGCDVLHDDSLALLTTLALPALCDLKVDGTDADESALTASGVMHLREFTQLTRLEI